MSSVLSHDMVGIEKISSVDYLEKTFDCYRDGLVAVAIDPDVDAPAFLRLSRRITPAAGGGWFTRAQAPMRDDRPGQITFSSGTTGQPKAVLVSNRALADVTDRLIAAMDIDGDIREYLGVPATYSFGLGRARVIAAVGGSLYLPEAGFDPREFSRMLANGEVNALSAVPTLLRLILQNPELIDRKAARKLRWLEIGSQPMSVEDKRDIRRMFPGARIVQHYGLTEASRTTFLDVQEATAEQLASVGRPIGSVEVRIDGDGHVCIRGPHVADGILTEDGLQPLVDADGWLRTNDLGSVDADGFLQFLGRADDLLNVGGIKVPGGLFEDRLAALIGPDAAHVAVVGITDPLRGQIVGVTHEPRVAATTLAAHAREVAGSFGLGAADVKVVQVAAISRTATGKVRRSETLAAISAAPAVSAKDTPVVTANPTAAAAAIEPLSEREREIAAIWREALGVETIGRNDTFYDLGGDSLSAITAMLRMERAGIPNEITQQIFEGRSVAEIAATVDGAPRAAPARRAQLSDAITITRGIMVLVVVAGHWLPYVLVRTESWAEPLMRWAGIFFHFGTPGFAIVFGIGLAFFSVPMFLNNPARLRTNTRTNIYILIAGVATLAIARGATLLMTAPERITLGSLFYSVLFAYLLLVAASIPLLRLIAHRREPILAALLLGLGSLTFSALIRQWWPDPLRDDGVNFIRLLIATKYGFPEMLGYVGLGMSMGLWFDRAEMSDRLPAQSILSGIAVLFGSALVTESLSLEHLWFAGSSSTPMLVAYCGLVLILFGAILHWIRGGLAAGALKVPVRVMLMIGILAFPAYVGHEVVMSVREILGAAGVIDAVAIFVPVAVFLIGFVIATRRLYRLHYGR